MLAGLVYLNLASETLEFRAMSFNIWRGGTQHQPLSKTVEVIRTAKADIVGIQEPDESLESLAKLLGWNRSDKASIVTKYPILSDWKVPGNRWGGAKIKLPGGQIVVVYNDHLNPYPYGPYEIRDGKAKTQQEVEKVEQEAGRVDQMRRILDHNRSRGEDRLPVILVGDLNTPSHLDWTSRTAFRNFGKMIVWPVTKMAADAGFRDALREVHPDALAKPAYTWSPGYPVPKLEANDVMDRIDFVLVKGRLKVLQAQIVGERGAQSDIGFDLWPSDHRAVVATFRHR